MHPDDRDVVISELVDILERGDFPVRIFEGMNYHSLNKLS